MKPDGSRTVERIRHELAQYVVVSAYLYVCFGALLLYKAAILHAQGIEFEFYGLAFLKAVILGKFVLIGNALKLGGGGARRPLAVHIFVKAALFMLFLVFLSVIEEVIVALIHGRAAREGVAGVAGGSFPQALATSFLILLILIPYIAWREIAAEIGERKLLHLLLNPHSPQSQTLSAAPVDDPDAAVRARAPNP